MHNIDCIPFNNLKIELWRWIAHENWNNGSSIWYIRKKLFCKTNISDALIRTRVRVRVRIRWSEMLSREILRKVLNGWSLNILFCYIEYFCKRNKSIIFVLSKDFVKAKWILKYLWNIFPCKGLASYYTLTSYKACEINCQRWGTGKMLSCSLGTMRWLVQFDNPFLNNVCHTETLIRILLIMKLTTEIF